jgi:hypothetical protein
VRGGRKRPEEVLEGKSLPRGRREEGKIGGRMTRERAESEAKLD